MGWSGWRDRMGQHQCRCARRADCLDPASRIRLRVCLLLHDREHVAGGEDEVVLVVVLDLGAAVLRVDNDVADLDVERDSLVAVLVEAPRTYRKDLALLGLLLSGVGDDETGCGRLLGFERLDEDAILERLDGDRHGDVLRCELDVCWSPRRRGVGLTVGHGPQHRSRSSSLRA